MASINYTIDNIDPLIQYTPPGNWREGSDTADPWGSQYSNGETFTLCTTKDSTVEFTFSGTQVFVYGAKRDNHGPYTVLLDNDFDTLRTFDGYSFTPTWEPLFVSDVLPQSLHTVALTNVFNDTNKPYLDIDYITWTSIVDVADEPTTLEDTSTAFSYQPPDARSISLSLTGFSSGNGHITATSTATASITFFGSRINLFGAVGPTISLYKIILDGIPSLQTYNATKATYTPQVMLYHADGLSAGPHVLQVMPVSMSGGQMLAIDYAMVAGATGSTTTSQRGGASTSAPIGSLTSVVGNPATSNTAAPAEISTSAQAKSILAAEIGTSLGVFVSLLLGVIVFYVMRRRRARRSVDVFELHKRQRTHPSEVSPFIYNEAHVERAVKGASKPLLSFDAGAPTLVGSRASTPPSVAVTLQELETETDAAHGASPPDYAHATGTVGAQ